MKYFLDTEFLVFTDEDQGGFSIGYGGPVPIQIFPISIGIAAEDGRDFYAVYEDAERACDASKWLSRNVKPYLGVEPEKSAERIAEELLGFMLTKRQARKAEWVAGYGTYDFVILCQTMGGFRQCPWKQIFIEAETLDLPLVEPVGNAHNALDDARTLRKAWRERYI